VSNSHLYDDDYLPDNLPECHKLIKELRAEIKRIAAIADTVALLQQRVAELENQVRKHNRARYGKSSAKVPASSLTGTGKVVYDTGASELDAEKSILNIAPDEKNHGGGGRTAPTKAPKQRDVEHKIIDANALLCPCCGKQLKAMGFEVSYQLDVVKSALESLRHIQFKYTCPECEGQIVKAPKPESVIDKGYPTEGLLAHIGVSKFDWHLPLYRQERIYLAQGVPLARSTMCRWLKHAADLLELIVNRMHQLILNSRVIQSDTTTMPVIKKGLGKAHQGYTWIFRGDNMFPYIIYDFTETQQGIHAERMLAGFKNILQTDGASIFNGVIARGAKHAGCLSHAFRYFEAAKHEDPERADYALAIMKLLFDIEVIAVQTPEEQCKDLRERLSKPKLDALKLWLEEQAADETFLPKSDLGKAIGYCLNQWDALCLYADTGFVQAHNNNSENGLRPAVLGKNNWLFAGSVEGGRTAAIWMSIVQTCRRHKIDPFEYVKDVLTRLPSATTSQIDQFLPDRWKASQKAQP
jgi:transposase